MQKKIRDIERLIKKKGETEELLARLAELKQDKAAHDTSLIEKKHADKYHMVKFFERKKVVRKILTLEHEIASLSGKELKKAEKKRKQLEEDLCYVLYYPNRMKYIALFAGSKDSEEGGDDKRSDLDEKTEKLRQEALALALKSRQEDMENNNNDKVSHAIEVGRNPSSHKRSKKAAADGSGDDESDVSEDDLGSGAEDSSIGRHKKRKLQTEVEKPLPLAKPVFEKLEKPAKKAKAENANISSEMSTKVPAATAAVPEEEEETGDSFFLEEAAEHDRLPAGATAENAIGSGKHRVSVGDLRRAGAQNKGNYSRIKDNGLLTKQELRLARWQEKVRGKNRTFVGGGSFDRKSN
jgi:hypothetical protein